MDSHFPNTSACFHGREMERIGFRMISMSLWVLDQVLISQVIHSDIQDQIFLKFIPSDTWINILSYITLLFITAKKFEFV
jgi:hypothetical protein